MEDSDSSPDPTINLDPSLLACITPAMSAECERVFSSTKKLITPERNKLHIEIIEASECLKNWWDRGLIEQRNRALDDPNADEFEPQDDADDDGEP
jgi:hypothetical protein